MLEVLHIELRRKIGNVIKRKQTNQRAKYRTKCSKMTENPATGFGIQLVSLQFMYTSSAIILLHEYYVD